MTSLYDVISIAAFGAILALFVNRHMRATRDAVPLLHYLAPGVGLAGFDLLGNAGHAAAAWACALIAVAGAAVLLAPAGDGNPRRR